MADKTSDSGGRTQLELWIGGAAALVLGLLCLLVLRPFISAVLWAGILCFTTWPLFLRLENLLGGRLRVARGRESETGSPNQA